MIVATQLALPFDWKLRLICQIVTGTLGNMLEGVVHGDVQDHDGAPDLERLCDADPTPSELFADGG
jgi:hypothetical protein